MRYRLICTDMDGTLLDQHARITTRVRDAVAELQRRGVTVVLSSARPPRAILPYYEELGLNSPIIASNGAMIYQPTPFRVLAHHPIPADVAQRVVATIRSVDPAINIGAEFVNAWQVDRIDARLQALLDSGKLAAAPTTGPIEEALANSGQGVNKLYSATIPPDLRAKLEERFASSGLAEQVTCTSSGSGFFEVMARGVDKGAALRALAAILQIPREETIALGDEENDLPALRAAGLGIAMGNASDRVKAAAGAVTGHHTADGWVHAIERHVLSA